LHEYNDADRIEAQKFQNSASLIGSLKGGYDLFSSIEDKLPKLPTTLHLLIKAQDDWLKEIIRNTRNARSIGIGNWNATAMFMVALLLQPDLATSQIEPRPLLPAVGPIDYGLELLARAKLVGKRSAKVGGRGSQFDLGFLQENNSRLADLLKKGGPGWSMMDVHDGVYLLGTKNKLSMNFGA
jgi:hypothetical protein